MRERVAEIVTLDLGPRQQHEVRKRLQAEIRAERLTSIDRSLLRAMGGQRVVEQGHRDAFHRALRAGRLKKLEALGLAEPLGDGRWVLAPRFEDRLRALGARGDIIRTMQRELAASALERAPSERMVHDGAPGSPVTGRIVARGLADEHSDRHYLIVDGTDGRVHWIDIGGGASLGGLPKDAIVRVVAMRDADRSREAGGASTSARKGKAKVEILSPLPLGRLPQCEGASWLASSLGVQ